MEDTQFIDGFNMANARCFDQLEIPQSIRYSAQTANDGRVDIDLDSGLLRSLPRLVPSHQKGHQSQPKSRTNSATATSSDPPEYTEADHFPSKCSIPGVKPSDCESSKSLDYPRLNLVIQVVGSRGDVQPFVALGIALARHGHRVRIATHDAFRGFVLSSGLLEFYPVGGDPAELMAYMVKNPGLVPSMKSLKAGDIQKKRKMVAEMLDGFWHSCVRPDPATSEPFVAEAILANPPSFAHVHCAQALSVPLHLMFTMPWTTTKDFCHPLANLKLKKDSKISRAHANRVSYLAVEWMTWQGLSDVINTWRETLDLEPVPFSEGPGLVESLEVPFTYCWSPSLVPKPEDWPSHIDVCGFFFRDTPEFTPDPELAQFLESGAPPVYIGFGSIVIEEAEAVTNIILEATRVTGIRVVVSRGWSNLGGGKTSDSSVHYLGDCPHEWLFQHVAAVVHHGGAGTTACGLRNGKPTLVVPFFGDQPFWGSMIAAAGAGPEPIPFKSLNVANLVKAIQFCLAPEASAAAQRMARDMQDDKGIESAVASFHANLPRDRLSCDILPHFSAAWTLRLKGQQPLKLSKEAAEVLLKASRIIRDDLKRYETKPTYIELKRWDPVTATSSSLTVTGLGMARSAADIVVKPIQAFSRSPSPSKGQLAAENAVCSMEQSESTVESESELYGRSAATHLPPSLQSTEKSGLESSGDTAAGHEHRAVTALHGSASGVGGFFKHWTKGFYLDMPLAAAEGMRNAPRLYGGEVYDPGRVTNWKTGGEAAGKNFIHGVVEGFGGVVSGPLDGARKHGGGGAAKAAGVGLLNLGAKLSSGVLGLVAFPGQGLYMSARSTLYRSTRRTIKEARREEGEYTVASGISKRLVINRAAVMEYFDGVIAEGNRTTERSRWEAGI